MSLKEIATGKQVSLRRSGTTVLPCLFVCFGTAVSILLRPNHADLRATILTDTRDLQSWKHKCLQLGPWAKEPGSLTESCNRSIASVDRDPFHTLTRGLHRYLLPGMMFTTSHRHCLQWRFNRVWTASFLLNMLHIHALHTKQSPNLRERAGLELAYVMFC